MGGGQPGGIRVDHERDVAGNVLEDVLEPQAQVLEAVEGPLCVGGVAGVVARGEAEAVGCNPGDASSVRDRDWGACATAFRVGRDEERAPLPSLQKPQPLAAPAGAPALRPGLLQSPVSFVRQLGSDAEGCQD